MAATVDRRDFAYSDTPGGSWIPPYVPPAEVKCVWCGETLSAVDWLAHQVDTHFDECYASWVRGLALLKTRERYMALRRAAKARYGGRQVRA